MYHAILECYKRYVHLLWEEDAFVHGYANVDFGGNVENKCSTIDMFLLLLEVQFHGSLVCSHVGLSTTEGKYVAANEACKEAI